MAEALADRTYAPRTQNVRVVVGKNEPSPEYEQSVSRTFEQKKSIQGEVDRLRNREAANAASYNEAQNARIAQEAANEAVYRQQEEAANQRRIQAMIAAQERIRSSSIKHAPGKLRSFSWMGLGVAFTLYIWQLVFALIAAAGLLIKSGQASLSEGNILENVAGTLLSIPADGLAQIGGLAWGIVILLSILEFIVFFIWFKFQGINPFETTLSMFCTFLLLALNILPIINIFPWLMIWIIAMNVTGTSQTIRSFAATR